MTSSGGDAHKQSKTLASLLFQAGRDAPVTRMWRERVKTFVNMDFPDDRGAVDIAAEAFLAVTLNDRLQCENLSPAITATLAFLRNHGHPVPPRVALERLAELCKAPRVDEACVREWFRDTFT